MENTIKYIKPITTYMACGKKYIICRDEHGFWGIDTDLIDSDGRITRQINGLQGHLSKTMKDCMRTCYGEARTIELKSKGMDMMEALQVIYEELQAF